VVTDRPIALPVNNSLISQNPFSANPIFKKEINSEMPNIHVDQRDLPIKHQPKSKRYYFDVGIGSVCLFGEDTGGAYTLLEASLAPGIGVPRHTHTREDESYYVTAGELEVTVGDEVYVLKEGDTLMAPRNIPHELRNSGSIANHYLLMFSPAGFEKFVMATALPAPANAVAPTAPQLQGGDPSIAIQNVHRLAAEYGIIFGTTEQQIAETVVFLASDESKHITGQEFRVGSQSERAKSAPKPAGVVDEFRRKA